MVGDPKLILHETPPRHILKPFHKTHRGLSSSRDYRQEALVGLFLNLFIFILYLASLRNLTGDMATRTLG
jgi:hypothetical protein